MKYIIHSRIYIVLFQILIPIAAVSLTVVGFFDSSMISKYVVLYILPVFLMAWFCASVVESIRFIYNSKRDVEKEKETSTIVFFCIRIAMLGFCCFVELFARSILVGGFHAS